MADLPPIPPIRYGLPGVYATRALPDSPTERHLGAMFTAIVNSLTRPDRRSLGHVIQNCHTRLGRFDPHRTPIFFFTETDRDTTEIARNYLSAIARQCHPSQPFSSAPVKGNTLVFQDDGFERNRLIALMDDETQKLFPTGSTFDEMKCIELGYRYLKHMERPDLPLAQTMRQLPKVDYDYTRHVIAMNDSDEDWTDDDEREEEQEEEQEEGRSDDGGASSSEDDSMSDEESVSSMLSKVTYESETAAKFGADAQSNARGVD